MKMILSAENAKMDDNALELLIESSGNDIRQMINTLQLQTKTQKSLTFLEAKNQYPLPFPLHRLRSISKDEESMSNPFEAATKLLNQREVQSLPFRKKMNLFFIDFQIMPLLIHENYLTCYGQNQTVKDVKDMAESADYISLGDCIDKAVHSENDWNLLPDVGLCSAIAPAIISARMPIFAKFPT